MEVCETSSLQTAMVPRLHQSNGYFKRKLRVWRARKCNALDGAETPLTFAGSQTTPFHWESIGPKIETWKTSGLPTAMVPRLHQSNDYIKRKLRVWRARKCNALVSAETPLTCAGSQTTPFHGGEYRVENGNMRKFGPNTSHGIEFVPKQWLHQKEATCMESSKM